MDNPMLNSLANATQPLGSQGCQVDPDEGCGGAAEVAVAKKFFSQIPGGNDLIVPNGPAEDCD